MHYILLPCADCFVKVYLLQNGKKINKKKTSMKRDEKNPIYNEAMIFSVPATSLPVRISGLNPYLVRIRHSQQFSSARSGHNAQVTSRKTVDLGHPYSSEYCLLLSFKCFPKISKLKKKIKQTTAGRQRPATIGLSGKVKNIQPMYEVN